MSRLFSVIGAVFAGLAVAAGAFGAHFLKATLTPDMLNAFETGVRYQMYHAVGLFLTWRCCAWGTSPAGSATPWS